MGMQEASHWTIYILEYTAINAAPPVILDFHVKVGIGYSMQHCLVLIDCHVKKELGFISHVIAIKSNLLRKNK
jgi:hypothetical protein